MRYVLTNAQMREADGYTIGNLGVPSLVLMARAGMALADEAKKMLASRKSKGKVLVVCGGGNNGGDGFFCAQRLLQSGVETDVVFFAERSTSENEINRKGFLSAGGKIYEEISCEEEYALVIDCLLGTGFKGEVSEKYKQAILKMNEEKARGAQILSADIPSGVNGENGFADVAVNADKTLCIGEIKAGVLLGDGIDHAGEILRANIGICLPNARKEYAFLIGDKNVSKLLPKRKRNSHKGTYGKAAIVAGSGEYTGAAYLSAAACLRAGAGYTALFVPKELLPYYVLKLPEALLFPLNEGDRVAFTEKNFKKLLAYDCIAYGMGMGASMDTALGAEYLLRTYTGKLLLDADALNSLAQYKAEALAQIFAEKKCDVIITPHCKEFSRLTGESVRSILEKGLSAPFEFAKMHRVTVLLKNAVSVVTDGEKTAVNAAGTAGQAKGGSGDVLSGAIAGLCASGLSVFDGAVAGAYLAGRAAEIAAEEFGEYSLLATDVIARLGKAFLSVTENADKKGGEE